jgi:hypothetical protein
VIGVEAFVPPTSNTNRVIHARYAHEGLQVEIKTGAVPKKQRIKMVP